MSVKQFIIILLVIVVALGVFAALPVIGFVSGFPDFDPPKYEQASFNMLANDIIRQEQIIQMDDLTRYYKRINRVNISFTKPEKSDTFEGLEFIDDLLDSMKVDRQLVENLRYQLEKTKLREFIRSNDSVLFRVDGYNGHSYGYFYSSKPMKPGTNSFFFSGYSVSVYQDVNPNWKKANIRP